MLDDEQMMPDNPLDENEESVRQMVFSPLVSSCLKAHVSGSDRFQEPPTLAQR